MFHSVLQFSIAFMRYKRRMEYDSFLSFPERDAGCFTGVWIGNEETKERERLL